MGETSISWTNYSFNPWWGCVRVSPGCANCYADRDARRYGYPQLWSAAEHRAGDHGFRFFGDPERQEYADPKVSGRNHWDAPLLWQRRHDGGDPRRIVFCASMADVFEDHPALAPHRLRLWNVIESTPRLVWLLLTKRPELATRFLPAHWLEVWPGNVVFGISVEDQKHAALRMPIAQSVRRRTGCRIMVSYEPALGPVLFDLRGVDQVIVGGESGPGARPFALSWARDTIRQCREAGVAAFVKQLGAIPTGPELELRRGRIIIDGRWMKQPKGDDPAEWPEDLRVQEIPW